MTPSLQILIVEDSNIQAHKLNRVLTRNGFSVDLCVNASQALAYLERMQPDLIITDIMMPGMNGFEFCQRVKQQTDWASIPVIVLTELSDPMDVFQGLKSGADCFVTKPYNDDFLLERIQTVIDIARVRDGTPGNHDDQVVFKGQLHDVDATLSRATDLLFATYENAIQKNRDLIRINRELSDAKRELQRQNHEMAQLHEEKNRFIGIAAHDLRNPLGIVQGFSEILVEDLREKLNTAELDSLYRIRNSAEFMLNLVNDLLDVAQIEAGRLELVLKSVRLADLVRESIDLHRLAANAKNILVDTNVPMDLPELELDATRITQVLNNLLSNAIKYSPEGALIEIFTRQEKDEILLAVRDRGPGIPREEQAKLFQPFSRTSVQPRSGEKSTGLGLAIVKKIVDAHQGRCWADSEEGRGSTFFVSLPVVRNTSV